MRCIDADGSQVGIIATGQALNLARSRDLDLVEISPNAQPPVCRIMDVGKYKFELAKKEKQAKQNQAHTRVKEVKFHANTDTHDYEMKVRHIRDFIEEGHRVKISLMFRGREQAHQEIGYDLMRRVARECDDIAIGDKAPQHMGRTLLMLLSPRPSTAIKAATKAAAKPEPAAGQPPAGPSAPPSPRPPTGRP